MALGVNCQIGASQYLVELLCCYVLEILNLSFEYWSFTVDNFLRGELLLRGERTHCLSL